MLNVRVMLSMCQTCVLLPLSFFQMSLGLSTVIFELEPQALSVTPRLDMYHDLLIEHVSILCKSFGRGLSYVLQGLLWLVVASWLAHDALTPLLVTPLCAFLCGLGLLHCAVDFGLLS